MDDLAATPTHTEAGIEPAPLEPGHEADIDLVVIGASAGGLDALVPLIERLPREAAASLLVVMHLGTTSKSQLHRILRRATTMPVVTAIDDVKLRRREIVVARPDRHLLVDGDRLVLSRAAKVNGHRPAIDPLFESASRWFGPRVLGILLSGLLDDGVAGLGAIHAAGGVTAAQDPAEASRPDMPVAAIESGVVDHVLPAAGLAELVGSLTARGSGPLTVTPAREPSLSSEGGGSSVAPSPANLSCPNCGGVLQVGEHGGIEQYECRVGHRYSPASLFEEQTDVLDTAMWMAHRSLLERADLSRRIARRLRRSGLAHTAEQYESTAGEADHSASVLLQVLTRNGDSETIDEEAEDVGDAEDGADVSDRA